MPDFKKLTLERLRELARTLLGPGHAKKTKAALVAALEGVGKKPAPAPSRAAGKSARGAASKAGGREGAKAAARAGKAAGPAAKPAAKPVARQGVRTPARKAAPAEGEGAQAAPKARPRNAAPPLRVRSPEGPDPDGFFVARVRGEEAVREAPHPMTETTGEPWSYGDDAFVALPRDPTSLFLYWDFGGDTLSRGFEGLDRPRTQLWIHGRAAAGWERVRVVEFALESRGFYVHDLEPGRTYRAEVHVVDRSGRERLLGAPSNEIALPSVGPSPIVDDRFLRIPWDVLLGKILSQGHPGAPFPEDARAMLARLSDWARFQGPTWGGSAGGMGGRPFSPVSSPSSPGGGGR